NIRPYQPLVAGRAEQVRGMKRRHEPYAAKILPVAAQLADGNLYLEHRLHGECAQSDDRARAHNVNLAKQKRLARSDFVGLRISIVGRAALDHVADVHVGAADPNAALDDV